MPLPYTVPEAGGRNDRQTEGSPIGQRGHVHPRAPDQLVCCGEPGIALDDHQLTIPAVALEFHIAHTAKADGREEPQTEFGGIGYPLGDVVGPQPESRWILAQLALGEVEQRSTVL